MTDDDETEYVATGTIRADALSQYIETLRAIVDEAKIHFNDGGLTVSAVDPANVGMFNEVHLDTSAFEAYESPGAATIGANLTRLQDYLGSANSDDLVTLGVDMESRYLHISYRQIAHRMALIDPDAIRQEPDFNELDLPNYVEIQGEALTEAIDNVDLVSDNTWIEGDPESDDVFSVWTDGDTDETRVAFASDDLRRDEIAEAAKSFYSLLYLDDFTDVLPDDAVISIEFGDEFPLVFGWDDFDGALTVRGALAPRIKSQ